MFNTKLYNTYYVIDYNDTLRKQPFWKTDPAKVKNLSESMRKTRSLITGKTVSQYGEGTNFNIFLSNALSL